jgi:hypothetical protein
MAELRLIASATEVMAVYQAVDAVAQQAKTARSNTEGFTPIEARPDAPPPPPPARQRRAGRSR